MGAENIARSGIILSVLLVLNCSTFTGNMLTQKYCFKMFLEVQT
jgi:hypothetical protein